MGDDEAGDEEEEIDTGVAEPAERPELRALQAEARYPLARVMEHSR
jgi:hypothetical protein